MIQFDEHDICPHSGLPIKTGTAWIDLELSDTYRATFKMIGDRILLAVPDGAAGSDGMLRFFEAREQFLQAMGVSDSKIVEIKDFSKVPGNPGKQARMQFIEKLQQEEGRLIGWIGFNVSYLIKTMYNAATAFKKGSFFIKMTRDYPAALDLARKLLEDHPSPSPNTGLDLVSDVARDWRKCDPFDEEHVRDVLTFIKTISWEQQGDIPFKKIPDDHPFKLLFDALVVIKLDIDALLEERSARESVLADAKKRLEQATYELRSSRDDLEIRVRERTAELEESYEQLKLREHEIEQLNEQLAARVVERTEKLRVAEDEIIKREHKSELADITSSTLHNVKNILNSVRVSSASFDGIASGGFAKSFKKANELLRGNIDNIENFICHNPKGKLLMKLYLKLDEQFDREAEKLTQAAARVREKIGAIERIVSVQQGLTGGNEHEPVELSRLIDDALTIQGQSLESLDVQIRRDYSNLPELSLDKTKLVHVLVNLIKNAKEAMHETPTERRRLHVSTRLEGEYACLEVTDTGHGISAENLAQMFTRGFTTKKDGHGFGLHSSSIYMKEMGGELFARSAGVDQGATFELRLPLSALACDETDGTSQTVEA